MKRTIFISLILNIGIIMAAGQMMYKSEAYWKEYDDATTKEVTRTGIIEELTYIYFGPESVKLSGEYEGEYLVTGATELEKGEAFIDELTYTTNASKLSTTDAGSGSRISILITRYAHPKNSNENIYTIIFTLPDNYRFCFIAKRHGANG